MITSRRNSRFIILGCGYLGRAVATLAQEAGWTVEALTRNPDTAEALRTDCGIRVAVGDLAGMDWHESLDPNGATVVNCVSGGGGGEAAYARSYRDGMRSLVAWVQRGRPRVVVYTSSTSVYPDAAGDWVDEDAPTAGSPRAGILLEAETILQQAVEAGPLPAATVLRLAGIYGPARHYLIDQVRSGAPVLAGYGDCFLNLIHRDDAARAILQAIEEVRLGFQCFNVSDGQPATKSAIVEWTAAQLGRPPPVFDPALRSPRQARRSPFDAQPPNRRIANQRIREALAWTPTFPDFRAGYADLV